MKRTRRRTTKTQLSAAVSVRHPTSFARARRMHLEALEERRLLAVLVANPVAADGDVGSLRALISEANASSEADTIQLPAGDYQLTIEGEDDANAFGDLDITDDLTIVGLGNSPSDVRILGIAPGVEVLQDRVFDILGSINVEIQGVQISGGNTVTNGGGIRNLGGHLTVRKSIVTDNHAAFWGGGIANFGALTVIDSEVSFNTASRGGGIYEDGANMLGNVASFGETHLTGTLVRGNAAHEGAGIFTAGIVHTKDVWFDGNVATGPNNPILPGTLGFGGQVVGGGITAVGPAELGIDATTFSFNLVDTVYDNAPPEIPGFGGGIALFNNGTSTVTNSTFSGNGVEGYGGAIYNAASFLDLTHDTIVLNGSSREGDAMFTAGAPVRLANTIVANGVNGDDLRGPFESRGNNLFGEPSTGSNHVVIPVDSGVDDLFGTDPGLLPLLDNGGFGPTHEPDEGSPAIDNGRNDFGLPTDQRGVHRPVDEGFDIGALERAGLDYGDAPDALPLPDNLIPVLNGYNTLLENNGARHALVVGGPILGLAVDSEPNGQPSADADLDDISSPLMTGTDDEDAVDGPIVLPRGATTDVQIASATGGILNAWVDLNADGDWDDDGEHVAVDVLLMAGSNSVPIVVPETAHVGPTFARLRINSVGGLSYNGFAPDGEVEDHRVKILEAQIPEGLTAVPDVFCFQTPDPVGGNVLTNDQAADKSSLTAQLVAGTKFGTLDFQPDGEFTYMPRATFFGLDSFTYFATDGQSNSETVVVTLKSAEFQFIENLYIDLMGRPGTLEEIASWVGVLVTVQDAGPVVAAFQASREYRSRAVNLTYQALLGRAPEATAHDFWITQLGNGMTLEEFFVAILASDEYYQKHGGTGEGFVDGLYHDLLGRAADAKGREFWVDRLNPIFLNRAQIAGAFLTSQEFYQLVLNNPQGVGAFAELGSFYQHFLKRPGDSEGVAFWIHWFHNGDILTDVQRGFLTSPEYMSCGDHALSGGGTPTFRGDP